MGLLECKPIISWGRSKWRTEQPSCHRTKQGSQLVRTQVMWLILNPWDLTGTGKGRQWAPGCPCKRSGQGLTESIMTHSQMQTSPCANIVFWNHLLSSLSVPLLFTFLSYLPPSIPPATGKRDRMRKRKGSLPKSSPPLKLCWHPTLSTKAFQVHLSIKHFWHQIC